MVETDTEGATGEIPVSFWRRRWGRLTLNPRMALGEKTLCEFNGRKERRKVR